MKKMRRMIPALCMLLVSAIMLTTASYAWFTMNDAVTASGMQIQAKSDGSLVISNQPLTYKSIDTEANVADTSVKKLKPMTWTERAGKWQEPANAATVNPVSGKVDSTTGLADIVWGSNAGMYYYDHAIFIGSAGDILTGKRISLTLNDLIAVEGNITKAYSVAIYYGGLVSGKTDSITAPAPGTEPVAIVHVDEYENRNKVVITCVEGDDVIDVINVEEMDEDAVETGFTIPSIVGVGDQNENLTGLKFFLRVYVDGNLESPEDETVDVPNGTYTYTQAGANTDYNDNTQYFVLKTGATAASNNPEDYTPANLENLLTGNKIPAGWYTRTENTTPQTYKYVNSENVPTAGSTIELTFTASDVPTAPETPADPDNIEGN